MEQECGSEIPKPLIYYNLDLHGFDHRFYQLLTQSPQQMLALYVSANHGYITVPFKYGCVMGMLKLYVYLHFNSAVVKM